MKKGFTFFAPVVMAMLAPATAVPAEPPATAADCGTCHALSRPVQPSLANRMEREAPPLYYAGNKFRREWLADWLQNPRRIRPAGDFPPAHTRTVDGKDEVDESTLVEHPALTAAEATEVAAWLMTLAPYGDLIEAEAGYTPGNVNPRLGALDFVKFKGCGACHKDAPEYGGFSGPELYTAWRRLRPEFITSYIRIPEKWEPYSLMPNRGLNTSQIHKLADYLRVISESEE